MSNCKKINPSNPVVHSVTLNSGNNFRDPLGQLLYLDYEIADLEKRGYSKSIAKAIKIKTALIEVIEKVDNPSLKNEEAENFYTREQLIEFLTCLEKESNFKAYTLFRLLAFSGMRKGEALALTWNDLNFKTNELRINKAIARGKNNQLYVKSTKTGIARTIKMDDKTMRVLKEWKKKQKQDYLILGFNTMQPKQLVFSNEHNEYLQPTKTRKWIIHV